MIRVYYMAEEGGVGGDNTPKKKDTSKRSTSPVERRDWNDFIDHLQRQGIAGSKELDQLDKNAVKPYLDQYRKDNPNTTVSEDLIPIVQREHEELRTGDSFAGMTPEQTRVMRKQFDENFTSRKIASQGTPFDSTLSRQYYPTFKKGDKDYGTDAESYMKDFATLPEKTGGGGAETPTIPKPDYKNQASRNSFLQQWQKKYGDLQGRGDHVLRVDDVPRGGGKETSRQISEKAASAYGLDPALLYASSMEEGMSGLYKNLDGTDTKHRKPGDFGYQDFFGDKEFPINGNQSFGLPDFANRFPDLVNAGLLPKSFESQFRGKKNAGEFSENDFKTPQDAMKAKAAFIKFGQNYVEQEAKKHNIELTPKQKEFFTLAFFNGGEGAVLKRLPEYEKKGYLKNDDFISKRPAEEQGKPDNLDVWGHVTRRLSMAKNLKEQKLFDDQLQDVAQTDNK